MRSVLLLSAAALALVNPPARAQVKVFDTSAGQVAVTTLAQHLAHPWSLAFLPDGRMLVTERPGRMRVITMDGKTEPLGNVPEVYHRGQAGLMDVILASDFAQSRRIFFCYAKAVSGGAQIAIAHAQLELGIRPKLDNVQTIYLQKGPPGGAANIGCRIVQAHDGNLFVSLGDHFKAEESRNLSNTLGKIIRITGDGKAPPDNPFVGKQNALPEIWAYGLRNAEGLAFNPWTNELWEQEHGPKGGDEINIIRRGGNYGWPVVSFGVNYDGTPVGTGKEHADGMIDPLWHWTPSIAPSGMAFYTGDLLAAWRHSLFNGALKFQLLSRLELKNDRPVREERMLHEFRWRIRDVRQGPDGALYLLTDEDNGRILRLAPPGK